MKIRDKILNKVADFVDKHKTPKIARLLGVTFKGNCKGIEASFDMSYSKELEALNQSGMIDFGKLLDEQLNEKNKGVITFCEMGNVICIDPRDFNYVETSHEYFDLVNKYVFVICNTKDSFDKCKEYVSQHSMYHSLIVESEDIPNKEAFNKLFKKNQLVKQETNEKEDAYEEEQELDLNENYVKIDGNIKKIAKPFTKKDGVQAEFVELEQNYEYNGKIKKNTIPLMLEGNVFDEFSEKIQVGDKICINGKLSTYTDKNKQNQSVINCYDLEVLSRNISNDFER